MRECRWVSGRLLNLNATTRTLVVLRAGFKSRIPCMAILNRPFSSADSINTVESETQDAKSPTIRKSPLFSGNKIKPKRFELSFDEYQKLRKQLRTRQRLAGLPIGFSALFTSSFTSAYMFPNMFDATPEQIQPIL